MSTKRACVRGRRHFLQRAVAGAILAPLPIVFVATKAAAAELVSESDPRAMALKYKMDATKSADRKDPAAVCDNCNYYTARPGEAIGTCAALGGGLVTAKGWCTAWEGY